MTLYQRTEHFIQFAQTSSGLIKAHFNCKDSSHLWVATAPDSSQIQLPLYRTAHHTWSCY